MSTPESSQLSIRTEAIAGITTFFTMAYIVIVNPSILSTAGTGMAFSGVLTATVLLCFVMTLLMGLYAKLPFAVAPGMGIRRDIHPVMYALAVVSIGLLLLEHVKL